VLLILLGAAIACSAAICQVWTRLRAIDYGYKLSKASRLNAELLEANRRLRLEIATLTSPARIARLAEGELGLRPPTPEQVRRLNRGQGAPRRVPAPVAGGAARAREPATELAGVSR